MARVDEDGRLTDPCTESTGLLLDFLQRQYAGSSTKPLSPSRKAEVKGLIVGKKRAEKSAAAQLAKQSPDDLVGYFEAIRIIDREKATSSIMRTVLGFWKARGEKNWMVRPADLWLKAKAVAGAHKQHSLLGAEVQHRLQLLRLKTALRNTPRESATERYSRLQKFWPQLHEGSRKADVRTAPEHDMRSPRTAAASREGKIQENMQGQSGQPCLTPTKSGRLKDEQLLWKTRPARSNANALQWDWSRGTKPLLQDLSLKQRRNSGLHAAGKKYLLSQTLQGRFSDSGSDVGSLAGTDSLPAVTPKKKSHRWWQTFSAEEQACPPTPFSNGSASWQREMKVASLPNLHRPTSSSSFHSPGDSFPERWKQLPPIQDRFTAPWVGATRSTTALTESPTRRYLRACHSNGVVPSTMPFVTGHSLKFDAKGKAITDDDLLVLGVMCEDAGFEEVDLEGNTSLSEPALVRFVESLRQKRASEALRRLSLRRIVHANRNCIGLVTSLLTDELRNLVELDLSCVPMGMRCQLPLCKAVRDHDTLRTLRIENIGLGSGGKKSTGVLARQCISELLGSRTLVALEIGWNCFTADVFDHLGERLVECQVLQTLGLANCSTAAHEDDISAVIYFIEYLAQISSLTRLDVSMNAIDFRGALIIEDALSNSRCLRHLDVSQNPLGVLGTRSLMRLLARETAGLEHLKMEDTHDGAAFDEDTGYQVFSSMNPGGRYSLVLSKPYHRSLLRMLYKLCAWFKLTPDTMFSEVTPSSFGHVAADANGVYFVPTTGCVKFVFGFLQTINGMHANISDGDFEAYFTNHNKFMRYMPSFMRATRLIVLYRSLESHFLEQCVVLDALAKDFVFSYAFVAELCKIRPMAAEVLARLLPCVDGGQAMRYLSLQLSPTLGDYIRVLQRAQSFLTLNMENPTGRYKLFLHNPVDFAVTECLVLLDCWETAIKLRNQLPDVSQHGNQSQVRNMKYQDRPLPVRSILEWHVPELGVLDLDYASAKRPACDEAVFDAASFQELLLNLRSAEIDAGNQLTALRLVSHLFFITSMQLRTMLGNYRLEYIRSECFVVFFNRVIDMQNEKVFRARFMNEELVVLRERLGFMSVFPFIQPEQSNFHFRLQDYDQRLAACVLIQLASKESRENLRNPSYIRADGTIDPFPLGVPRSWETFKHMPQSGVFEVGYECAPEDRKYKARKDYFETYGNWKVTTTEEEVHWWGSLQATPMDVQKFLEFAIARFPDLRRAFLAIDGEGGNGQISRKEFFDAIPKMGCKKFKGPNEVERINNVFNYLDPSGEGQISVDEFMVLNLLWKEVDLSIREFVQFCESTFGPDLEKTWNFLDEDESGEIEKHEWLDAVTNVGYFGPAMPIFHYLDKDDEGSVSYDEFVALHEFQSSGPGRPLSQ